MELCLQTTYFKFQNQLYEQTDGVVIGSPLSPIIANLYMEYIKEKLIQSAPFQPAPWIRYVDDTFVIWQRSEEQLLRFHKPEHPIYHGERESTSKIPFLDVLVTQGGHRLSTSVYCKLIHIDRYILYNYHHHLRKGAHRSDKMHVAKCVIPPANRQKWTMRKYSRPTGFQGDW